MKLPLTLACMCVALWMVAATTASAQPLPLPALPYAYDAFGPVLTESAMRTHHLGHHRAYTDKLNAALTDLRSRGGANKELAKLGVDALLTRLNEVPEDLRTAIRNNGGGYVNHDLFFQNLAPATLDASGAIVSGRAPAESSKIGSAITRDFGSFGAFKSKFTSLAMGVFGSGWVFLQVDAASSALKLAVTANQDNPAILAQDPANFAVMCLDVWEHAYYMDYTNKRADFVEAWWNIIGWDKVEASYSAFLQAAESANKKDGL